VIRLAIWLPPLAWMAVILWLSTGDFSAENTGGVLRPLLQWLLPWASASQLVTAHEVIRKAAHVTVYAVLAGLWFLTLTRERRWSARTAVWAALAISVAWACVDELHQATEPSRTGSLADVGFDSMGAVAASVAARLGWRVTMAVTTVLLWTAAVGGAIAIAINLAIGVASGALWVAVPVAAALLLVRRWWKPSRRPAAGRA
jgi:VanZ family protein